MSYAAGTSRKIIALYKAGLTPLAVAHGAGVSITTVYNILDENGLRNIRKQRRPMQARRQEEARNARALRPRHVTADARGDSSTWYAQQNAAFIKALRTAHPERELEGGAR